MDVKRFTIGWLAAALVAFALSYLWHVMLLADFYETQTAAVNRAEIDYPYVVLGYVVLGFLMALTYPIGYQGGSPTAEGFRFGALIGLIWILPWSLIIVGIWEVPLTSVLVDAPWHVVEEGLAGIALAMAYGREPASS